jgi:hypothetical protein
MQAAVGLMYTGSVATILIAFSRVMMTVSIYVVIATVRAASKYKLKLLTCYNKVCCCYSAGLRAAFV